MRKPQVLPIDTTSTAQSLLFGFVARTRELATGLPGLRTLFVALLIGLCAWTSIEFTRVGGVSSVWIVNGIVVGTLLLRPYARWPGLLAAALLGELVARALHGEPLGVAVALPAVNLLEIVLVAGTIRHVVPDITERQQLVPVAIVATGSTIVATAISALVAGLLITTASGGSFLTAVGTWFSAHLLGMVLVATLTVVALRERAEMLGREGHRVDFAVTMLAVVTVAAVVFTQNRFPLLFLVYLPLLLATFRHGFAGVVVGIVAIALVAGLATAHGLGPAVLVQHSSPIAMVVLMQLFVAGGCVLALPVAVALAERSRLSTRLRRSESRYRLLADHTRDLVVRLRADGTPAYISRSVTAMLGWLPQDLREPHAELIHADDRRFFCENLARLCRHGGSATMTYRIQHREGHYVWIEALAERIEGDERHAPTEVVYSGRDVSARVAAEQALMESQARLQAVTDNVPGMIAHVDASLRYTFVNATLAQQLGRRVDMIVGRTIREVRGDAFHDEYAAHFDAVLRGESPVFEGLTQLAGKPFHFKSHYVPDVGIDGQVRGFYALTYDITALKLAERKLERLARIDTLTGLANRREFDERAALALARTRRHRLPLALLSFDVDNFKTINDTYGHGAGDEVLRVFAQRLQKAVYAEDVVARLGGDEFVVLIENVGSPEMAELIARKLIHAMTIPVMVDDVALNVSTSVGIGFSSDATTVEQLSALSDKALYAAKAAGRNTYRLFCAAESARSLRDIATIGKVDEVSRHLH
jgi:diguanylate cyclase (GGDEF)-like protein/PAS domain S-box-containing protein